MDQLTILVLLSIPCFVVPLNVLIVVSVAGVLLADTALLPHEFIYYSRFVPMGALAFRALFTFLIRKSSFRIPHSMTKVWLPFLLLAFISAIYSEQSSVTLQRAMSALLVFIGFGFGIPYHIERHQKMLKLIRMLCLILGGSLLYCFLSTADNQSLVTATGMGEYERLHGIFRNPNTLGLLAMQTIFLLIYLWQRENRIALRYVLFAVVFGVGIAMLLSGSRGALLGFLTGLLVFIWLGAKIQRKKTHALFISVLLLLSIFVTVGIFFPEYSGSLFRTDHESRIDLLKHDWELALETPFFGVGFGGSDPLYFSDTADQMMGSHNSFTKLLVEMGFTGLILCLIAFFVLIRRAIVFLRYFSDPALGVAMISVIVGSLVNSLFEAWLFGFGSSATVPFWLFLAILSYQADEVALAASISIRFKHQHEHMAAHRTNLDTRPTSTNWNH